MTAANTTHAVRPRVLAADDNPVNLQIALRMLEALGCEAHGAVDGFDAVAKHAQHAYDLILMDCSMPGLDGYEAAKRIRLAERARSGRRRIPIIALTATLPRLEERQSLHPALDEMMLKPLRVASLQRILSRWLPAEANVPSGRASAAAASDEGEVEAMRRLHGKDFPDFASLFLQDGRRRLDAMHDAGAAGDYATMAKLAHALRGSCVSLGARQLADRCGELEAQAKSLSASAEPAGDWRATLDAMESEWAALAAAIKAGLSAGSSFPSPLP